ncbi:hypothetical protein D9619_012596 [Psilocybe cf. subviscida]|uniref:Uncharacterized protein n=1 Tax=Psilocybe cf. subviscida TaxID=2480587 RepID=A0A8H5B6Z5_9AGAR|nr:hypothetical protein D9619_012596 [Psilocybe cf. subviscida]
MAPPLALELYHAIVQCVDNTGDLLSLALCCSAFRDEAQRYLFCHISPYPEHRIMRLISTINASPLRLGPLVYTFCLYEGKHIKSDEKDLQLISLALRSMCNLKHFQNRRFLPSTILQGCTFKLHTLGWAAYLDTSSLNFLFCNFLPTQPSIERLLFYKPCDPFDLAEVPKNLCPMLDFLLAGDNDTIGYLLRDDRLITRLQWSVIGGGLPTMSVRQLNHLKYLQCVINELRVPSFTLQLTSLVFLELYLIKMRPRYLGELTERLQFLQNLPCLEVLVLDDTYNELFELTPAYQRAFELCPTLKYIDALVANKLYARIFPSENGVFVSNTRTHKRDVLAWRREYGVGHMCWEHV